MKRLITCALLLLATTVLSAPGNPPDGSLPRSHELGLRYGVQLSLGAGATPEMQALSIDYACYGYSNIGFRTGLNLLVPTDIERGVSVPLQFSWRTGRIASAWRRARDEGESCRAYYNPWAGDPWAEPSVGRADPGQSVGSLLLSLLPSAFEIHAGFTPGLLFGPLGPGRCFVERPPALLLYGRCRSAADYSHLAFQPFRRLHLPLLSDGQLPRRAPCPVPVIHVAGLRPVVQLLTPSGAG